MSDLIDLHAEIASLRAKAKAIRAAKLVDLQAQIASLQAEAEAIREAEFDAVVDELRTTMAAHGINPADLDTKTTRRATKKTRLSVKAGESLVEQAVAEPIAAAPVHALNWAILEAGMLLQRRDKLENPKNLRPYELALMIGRAWQSGSMSHSRLAARFGVSVKAVGKATRLLGLPMSVVNAFPSPGDLEYRWGPDLQNAIARDRDAVMEEAMEIQSESFKPTAKEVFARLIAASAGPSLSGAVTPAPVEPKVPASDVAIHLIEGMPSNTSDKAARQAKKLKKLAVLQAQTTAAAAAVEPAEVENVVPPTKAPFDMDAFLDRNYKMPRDLVERLAQMTPEEIAEGSRIDWPSDA